MTFRLILTFTLTLLFTSCGNQDTNTSSPRTFIGDKNLSTSFDLETYRKISPPELVTILNDIRSYEQTCGGYLFSPVGELVLNEELTKSARIKSLDMSENDYFDHTMTNGRTWVSNITNYYPNYAAIAENISYSNNGIDTIIIKAWMKSESHCKNIMSPYDDIGVSSVGHYGTTHFGRKL